MRARFPNLRRKQRYDIPTNGLVSHFTCDRFSSTTLFDELGMYNGTITSRTIGGGKHNFALQPESVAATLRKADLGGAVTFGAISAWIRRSSLSYYGVIFADSANAKLLVIQVSSNGNYLYAYNAGTYNSNLPVADLNWHHLVANMESANYIRFWLDGVKASATVNYGTTNIRYFGRNNTATGQEVIGLDNVRIYSRVLLDDEIYALLHEDFDA